MDASVSRGGRVSKRRLLALGMVLIGLTGCVPSSVQNVYASNAEPQANKMEEGVVIAVRPVGAATAAIASQIPGWHAGQITLKAAADGSPVDGSAADHGPADTAAFEYLVRRPSGTLVSVTQNDKVPLALGQRVLVVSADRARVVPDYKLPPDLSATERDTSADPEKPVGTDVGTDANPPGSGK